MLAQLKLDTNNQNEINNKPLEHTMTSWDGSQLFYRSWHLDNNTTNNKKTNKAVILFHGGHEHSGRFQDLVENLDLDEHAIFAWDARGHGRSPGERGYADHFQDLVRDADCFIRHIAKHHQIPINQMMLLCHSVGSVIASTWVHDYAPPIKGMILGSPAFNVKLYAPFALPILRIWQKFKPNAFVNSYVKPGMLTHDQDEAEARRKDPLISPSIAVRVLTSLFETSERVIQGAASIKVPTLIFSAGSDRVVHRSAHQRFYKNLGSEQKILQTLPGFYHEVFHEKDRQQPISQAREFILQCFSSQQRHQQFISPANNETFKKLKQPLKVGQFSHLKYSVVKTAMQTIGKLSNGVSLGWESGFDSGRMLDYVYANKPTGWGPLGRSIDKNYLNSPGWSGIRTRRENLKQLLTEQIEEQLISHNKIHIADLAAGPGRYLLEVLQNYQQAPVTALCRDWDTRGLNEGKQLADKMAITSVAYEQGDAFSQESLAGLNPRPNIVIVSGLYELFEDNSMIMRSLRGIKKQLAPGGKLIYTNQPYHPQLEFIARTLINREGQPWVMRPRPQSEMNALVKAAGFKPEHMLMDKQGIFSVTVAAMED